MLPIIVLYCLAPFSKFITCFIKSCDHLPTSFNVSMVSVDTQNVQHFGCPHNFVISREWVHFLCFKVGLYINKFKICHGHLKHVRSLC
jgi:hypothetical protein